MSEHPLMHWKRASHAEFPAQAVNEEEHAPPGCAAIASHVVHDSPDVPDPGPVPVIVPGAASPDAPFAVPPPASFEAAPASEWTPGPVPAPFEPLLQPRAPATRRATKTNPTMEPMPFTKPPAEARRERANFEP
jgi:hypothetical protein